MRVDEIVLSFSQVLEGLLKDLPWSRPLQTNILRNIREASDTQTVFETAEGIPSPGSIHAGRPYATSYTAYMTFGDYVAGTKWARNQLSNPSGGESSKFT
ncbi:MAG: hypothetical protein QW238_03940 [Candidatus Bathyarchaeia archaeon]